MAASTLTPPANVVDCIRSWTAEEKDVALSELLEEVLRAAGGNGPIPITNPNGESLGYLVPPQSDSKTQSRVRIPVQTPEERERTQRALANLDRTFDVKEFFEQFSREDQD